MYVNTCLNNKVYIEYTYIQGISCNSNDAWWYALQWSSIFSTAGNRVRLGDDIYPQGNILYWTSDMLVFDDGSHFRDTVVKIREIYDIEWQRSGAQHQSASGIGELIPWTNKANFPKTPNAQFKINEREFLLSLAVKACDDTLGPEGAVPSALVFGEFPSSRSHLGPKVPLSTLVQWAQASLTARKTMAEAHAQSKLKLALKRQSPKVQYQVHSAGDQVLV